METVQMALVAPFYSYSYEAASNVEMAILGLFFTEDVGCDAKSPWRNWAFFSADGAVSTGNITLLEKKQDTILLSDQYSKEPVPTKLKISTEHFVKLCDEWQKKVVDHEPKKVIIKHEHGQFTIETSND